MKLAKAIAILAVVNLCLLIQTNTSVLAQSGIKQSIDDTIEGVDECDGCEEGTLTTADNTPVNPPAVFANADGPLIGEHYTVDRMRMILADWTKRGGLEQYRSDPVPFLMNNSLEIDTAQGTFSVYFEDETQALWIKDGKIVETSPWHSDTDGSGYRICLDHNGFKYCSYLFVFTTDFVGSLKLLRSDDDIGTSYNFWHGTMTEGQSSAVKSALAAEGPRQALRQKGVNPKDYDELVEIYSGYMAVRACRDAGLQFDDNDIAALEIAAKNVEQRIGDQASLDDAWEEGATSGEYIKIAIDMNPEKGQDACEGLRLFVQGYINSSRSVPAKPF